MTITCRETADSPVTSRSRNPQTTTLWRVRSDVDDITRDQAYAKVIETVAAVRDSLLINAINLTPTHSGKVWNAEVIYKIDAIPSDNFPLRFKGSTRGGTAQVNRSIATRSATARDGVTAIDYGGAINVDDKGQVKGTTVPSPRLEFSIELTVQEALFTYKYMRTLYQLTPSVNNKRLGPFLKWEVLFLGAEWSPTQGQNGDALTQINFYFEAAANELVVIPGFADPIDKKAHDELWFTWENFKDTGSGLIFRRPRQVNVEQVVQEQNLKKLGIGV